jgi:hypothetical protein
VKYILFLRLAYSFFVNVVVKKKVITGADIRVKWFNEEDPRDYYASFGVEPLNDEGFDSFGYPDDEIFYYFADIKELLRYIFVESHDGWTILDGGIFYSE